MRAPRHAAGIVELEPRRDGAVVTELVALQRAAYAVEAALVGFDGIPQLSETGNELRAAPERWLGLRDEQGLAGAVAFERQGDTLDVCRLVVAPRAHRRGHATALLDALDALDARDPRGRADRTVVSTGTANAPAMALYRRRGFVPTGEREIAPGVTVTALERRTPTGGPSPRSGQD